ncbi:class I SAM-dependent methyltransferase [Halogeometricum limi]|uniref:Methyltransferase domain-containing protein n=1 Tax=Halogeometricum limi TaxID=555875 RepID=A0A1I6GQU2_9EURY|nr:class I SAM-dependent methyltransferase [Halogeometricum limi]SFR44489.1 Methyltransferase domain-containing protein [Halogeometricum limi]
MDVPTTVKTALADQPVEGAVCLEAGAGVGNTTCGLLDAGARHVFAVTNDADHARLVRDRLDAEQSTRTTVLRADIRALPLPDDAVELVTAHGLLNVVPASSLGSLVGELRRVAAPGSRLVVDDYEPLPDDAAMRELVSLANAARELADGRPALTFYAAETVRDLFVGRGWHFDRRRTLLDPVPWTRHHVLVHANMVRDAADSLPDEFADPFRRETTRLVHDIGSESAGEMYSLAFRLPEQTEP